MISIIIPVLNEAQDIVPHLQDLRRLVDDEAEIIVVDGGSRDNTAELARPFCQRLIQSDKAGRARQMNLGAAKARGEVLLFLHADTRLTETAWKALQTQSGWGCFDIRLSSPRMIFRVIEFFINWRSRLSGIATGDQGIFVQRDLFQTVGAYDDIALMEDVALSIKLKKQQRPQRIGASITTSSRRWETFGPWRTIFLMWRLRWLYFCGADPDYLASHYRQHNT